MDLDIHRRRWRRDGGLLEERHFLTQPTMLRPGLPSAVFLRRALLPKFIVPWLNIRRNLETSTFWTRFLVLTSESADKGFRPEAIDPFPFQPRFFQRQQITLNFIPHLGQRPGSSSLFVLRIEQVKVLR